MLLLKETEDRLQRRWFIKDLFQLCRFWYVFDIFKVVILGNFKKTSYEY